MLLPFRQVSFCLSGLKSLLIWHTVPQTLLIQLFWSQGGLKRRYLVWQIEVVTNQGKSKLKSFSWTRENCVLKYRNTEYWNSEILSKVEVVWGFATYHVTIEHVATELPTRPRYIMICEYPRLVFLFRYRYARDTRSQFECFPSITFFLFRSIQGFWLSSSPFDAAVGMAGFCQSQHFWRASINLKHSFWGSSGVYIATVLSIAYIVSRSNRYWAEELLLD